MNIKHTLCTTAAAALLALAGASAQAAGNLVTNGGFETGDFTGWTLSGADVDAGTEGNLYGVEGTDPYPLPDGTDPAGGAWQAWFSDQTADPTTLSQAIATTAGTTYTVAFSLAQYAVGPGTVADDLTVTFGSGTYALKNIGDSAYADYIFTGVASGSSTTLSFVLGDDVGEFLVDDISVTAPAAPVPEPATLSMFGLGALAIALRQRRAAKR